MKGMASLNRVKKPSFHAAYRVKGGTPHAVLWGKYTACSVAVLIGAPRRSHIFGEYGARVRGIRRRENPVNQRDGAGNRTSNVEHRTSNIEHQTSNTRTLNTRTSDIEHRTSNESRQWQSAASANLTRSKERLIEPLLQVIQAVCRSNRPAAGAELRAFGDAGRVARRARRPPYPEWGNSESTGGWGRAACVRRRGTRRRAGETPALPGNGEIRNRPAAGAELRAFGDVGRVARRARRPPYPEWGNSECPPQRVSFMGSVSNLEAENRTPELCSLSVSPAVQKKP